MVPIDRPGKIVCVGLNYRDHAEEQGVELPAAPLFFAKYTTSLIGPGEAIVIPPVVEQCDYEAELGVVIGSSVRNVSRENAIEAVRATSSRTTSRRATCSSQTASGRAASRPTPSARSARSCRRRMCPIPTRSRSGRSSPERPCRTRRRRTSSSAIDEIISYASQTSTLEPGDLILTGTPAGVGVFRDPKRLLQPGDTVTIQIDGVGELTNPVVAARLTPRA